MKYSTVLAAPCLLSVCSPSQSAAAHPQDGSRKHDGGRVYNYNFQTGVKHDLSTNEVDGEFCDPNSPLSLSGYFGVEGSKFDTAGDKNYFYWFFEKRSTSLQPSSSANTEDGPVPFLIWLNGGPGCSSLLGLLTENGPCLVNSVGDNTVPNRNSWNEVAHVLYLDQPAKVGYSYGTSNDSNEEMVAEDAYYFLQAFFQSEEGQKYQDSPIFLSGESYAGHYIPAISHRILKGNGNYQENNLINLPLAGVAIGNPWVDPEEQFKWYAAMAANNSHGFQIFTDAEIQMIELLTPLCIDGIHHCNEANDMFAQMTCQIAYIFCDQVNMGPMEVHNISYYDITKPCIGELCTDDSALANFLNLNATKKALHVSTDTRWKECSTRVHLNFVTDEAKTVAPHVAELLNSDIPVLIYAGDLDYICNYMGTKAFTLNLDWNHKDDFNSAQDHEWNNRAGLVRSSDGFTFLQVYDAGHMVPSDQPKHALAMITQFLNGKAF